MMKRIYLGGPFQFWHKDYSDEKLRMDYRAEIIGLEKFKTSAINGKPIMLSPTAQYIGPFYFYEDHNDANFVVKKESCLIDNCTDSFFLIGTQDMPGTVTEMVYAAFRKVNVFVYYVKETTSTGEVGRSFLTPQWYPLTFISLHNPSRTECHSFDSYAEAKAAIIKRIKEYV